MHRQVLESMYRVPGFPVSERARQQANLAPVLIIRGSASEALGLLRAAERVVTTNPTSDPAQVVGLHFNFARAHALARDWTAAEDRYQRGFKILEARNALDGPIPNQGLLGLAYVYGKTSRILQARALYEKVLPYFRQLLGFEHPVVKRWEREYSELPTK